MEHLNDVHRYPVSDINGIMEDLRREYDLVRLVDIDECRVVEIAPDGAVCYRQECYGIWGRSGRCENCSSYRACRTHCTVDKHEYLGINRKDIHSVPVELVLNSGETDSFVVECVRTRGRDEQGAKAAAEKERPNDRSIDVLTRLYTLDRFYHEIRLRLLEAQEDGFLLLLINVRSFRLFNQLYGIEGGNRLLVGIGEILREFCDGRTVYGRCRDDRFAVLSPREGFDIDGFASMIQERARSLMQSLIFDVRIKIGVFEITDVNMPVTLMMEHAELAVNSICDSFEKPYAVFTPDMLERKLHDQRVLSEFGQAIENGEFQIYLQPQVRGDGSLAGAEALVRWVREDDVLLPGKFIPILARTELLSRLDIYVWEQTAALLGKWRGTPLDHLTVSVNVDPSDFYFLDVPQTLSELCEKYGVRKGALRVEITETALIEDIERQTHIVDRLRESGFSVEIDDFGRGSSSLSLLKDIHADTIKIDMGFLSGGRNSERSMIILESIIDMADNLGMNVITEGVETDDQMEKLSGIGCSVFQGFLFAKPMPVCDFELMQGVRT